MSKSSPVIRLRGVRHNNLKNFDLDLPTGKLIVFTGLSGSGKSSLAFDTLYAEGQRRYIETFSPYARQFFDRMDKPQVDKIEGIPPAIAIEQRNTVKTTRSTVGTMTEICDYMKVVWSHLAELHCRQCAQPVRKDSPQRIWERVNAECGARSVETLITFDLPLSEKLSLAESLALIARQGYQRLLLKGEVIRIDEASGNSAFRPEPAALTVVQDRIRLTPQNRSRFTEACEQAYHFGKGKLAVSVLKDAKDTNPASALPGSSVPTLVFSQRLHCAECDIEYREATPALFSFNHPIGACPACRGFGRTITIDYSLAVPDRSLTLAGGAIKPWQSGMSAECQTELARFCKHQGIPMDVPFRDLSSEHQRWIIDGDPDYGKDKEHEWPRAWYGVKGYFRWLESKSYKMHVRVLLSRYRAYTTCPECNGKRLKPEALLYRIQNRASMAEASDHLAPTLADFYELPVTKALQFIESLVARRGKHRANDPLALVLGEVRSRLGYLDEVGLGYLTLDRPTRSLSGGETERVSLTTCLGSRLVNTLFVLDEPSVGLHPRDTERLVRLLERLRDAGNTVVVVEHEPAVMRAADQIVDLGPGHGESGGSVVFQGPFQKVLEASASLTGKYLSGNKRIEVPKRRSVVARTPKLTVSRATLHNLKDLTVEIPLGRFVCVTGVSGSGKTTLVRDVLLPLLHEKLQMQLARPAAQRSDTDEGSGETNETEPSQMSNLKSEIHGWESIGRVVLVDQSPLGRTPRSNPAVYTGAFDNIRELFAQSDLAKQSGLNASAFSFNSPQGQCETCRGAGFEKIEMQFLSDVFIRCPECNGRRYRPHILEVKIRPPSSAVGGPSPTGRNGGRQRARPRTDGKRQISNHSWSIADMLDATVDEAIEFLSAFENSRMAERAMQPLRLLQEVGLGYLRLGQPINTLSGGESQRLKLVAHLAEAAQTPAEDETESGFIRSSSNEPGRQNFCPALFLFDEPTTGLHFDDVRVLLRVFQRLVDAGHSVLVIEHNLDLIKCADWLIDLGPEAGDQGGQLVAAGTPEQVARISGSHTGQALRRCLESDARQSRCPGVSHGSHESCARS